MSLLFQHFIDSVCCGKDLSFEESRECISGLFSPDIAIEKKVQFLKGLSKKGESVDEIVGFAQVMQEKMNTLSLSHQAMDLCGTGGVVGDRFNTSTGASFLVAASGGYVAKHGNRGSRKANGSFDFLEALEIPLLSNKSDLTSIFDSKHLCFLFARFFHPVVAGIAEARKQVGTRTIFNLLGPLCNPARVSFQIIGTLDHSHAMLLSESVFRLGTTRTTVIVSEDGTDELSPFSPAILYEITSTGIQKVNFSPKSCDIFESKTPLGFSDSVQNAALFCHILSQKQNQHPAALAMALNAGLALYNAGLTESIRQGFLQVQKLIKTGQAWEWFSDYQSALKVGFQI